MPQTAMMPSATKSNRPWDAPSRRVAEVLADPEQQHGGNDSKLTGNHEEGVAKVAPFIERLDLVGCEVALFGGSREFAIVVLSSSCGRPHDQPPGPPVLILDSITYRAHRASRT